MKRLAITLLALCAAAFSLTAQADWKAVRALIDDGSYKSAYAKAEAVYADGKAGGRQRLTAAYWMAQAAARYQEDAYDSAEARYRRLLPAIDGVDRALCYAFLGVYDTALADTALLRRTPVEAVKEFCHAGKTQNMTPTVYDMLVVMMQDRGLLAPREKVEWQRRLCALHADGADDLRIWHDCRLLDLMSQVPNVRIDLSTYQQYINKYRGTRSEQVTQLYWMAAQLCNSEEDYVRAVRYCDTAIALFPQSQGSVGCAGLKADIEAKRANVHGIGPIPMPGVASPQGVAYRNLDHLWFRVVRYADDFRWNEKVKERLLKAEPLSQWDIALPGNDSHRYEEACFVVPPLPAGHYLMLVSPSADFRTDGFMAYEVHCTDMLHYTLGDGGNLLVDRRTGRPIVGQRATLVHRERGKDSTVSTAVTDAEGRFRFDYGDQTWSNYVVIERDGYVYREHYGNQKVTGHTDTSMQCQLRVDRPIYRPGDTLHAAVVAYASDGLDGMVLAGRMLQFGLKDPNGKVVDTNVAMTDDYGVAAASFVLPTDRMAGGYSLYVSSGKRQVAWKQIRVEEYKQPRFMVTLGAAAGSAAPAFGRETKVEGAATTYSGVPVGGARVQYTVSRTMMARGGWRIWGYVDSGSEVARGETTTEADGSYSIAFVPEADSSVDLDECEAFAYTVHVDVTDINGESHEASATMNVGFRNVFVSLAQSEDSYRELTALDLHLDDINDRPIDGSLHVCVERLRRPSRALLSSVALESGVKHNTMTEDEWRRTFPLLAYSRQEFYASLWPVADTVVSGDWNTGNGEVKVGLPQLISGYYRIKVAADGADTLEHIMCLTRRDARRVQDCGLLWHDIDRAKAEVGETVTLQFGSAIAGTQVYYVLRVGNEERLFRRIDCSDDAIHTERIKVDSTMLGGFSVELFTVREGVTDHWKQEIDVPFSHKRLKVEIATFRDRLLPGESEEWTVRVSDKEPVKNSTDGRTLSNVIMTMYDDALNSYGGVVSWGFSPWRRPITCSSEHRYFSRQSASWLKHADVPDYNGSYPSVWTLVDALPRYWGRVGGRIMYKTASARNAVDDDMVELAVVETTEVEEEVFEVGAAMSGTRLAAVDEDLLADGEIPAVAGIGYSNDGTAGKQSEVQVRQNLGSLAFFVADVHTDSTGAATYRFTVPELLTRWNVRGLAFTKDLKIGTLDKTLVTAKPLMVQPNMPRFLRQGDSLGLMVKVVHSEPNGIQDVLVTMLLADAATGDTICFQSRHVAVSGASQVVFPVEVPRNVYVATYRVTAVADGMSDGEQGQVPVVSNRQAVTVSRAMYINGVGEKRYAMPEWLAGGSTREPVLVAAEMTASPVWLAIKSLPAMTTFDNPSSLYLANQLHVQTLGMKIARRVDLSALADTVTNVSRLRMNEEVKQTVLQATPWLRAADSEEQQMREALQYLDSADLRTRHEKLLSDLAKRQNSDGGWGWMPDGQSSLWVTQTILAGIKGERHDEKAALAYVDREHQRYYDRYVKPNIKKGYKWEPVNVDYLYMRSLYGKASTEAYRFYYANALKRYKDYENLYAQAQLAVVFHRGGDKKAALDLLRRIKEKSLVSDEMGLYWRDNRSGWFWYSRPIETQAMLIKAFAEITPTDTATIGLMQQWLLKQKQTTHWGNDRATAEAIDALVLNGDVHPSVSGEMGMMVFGDTMTAPSQGAEGYAAQQWTGHSLDSLVGLHSDTIVLRKSTRGIAWGAVYYQFADDIDKIPSSECGLSIRRTYLHEGPVKVGDRIKVRIEITADRGMDYIELVDGRPSCTEPLSTRAGWRWCDGLAYYVTVNNTDTRFYIEHIDKGHYVAEYELYVTNPGQFVSGTATIQCMYAPEFRAVSPAISLSVGM